MVDDADPERRFGGLQRLYGQAGYARLRSARVAVVGVGGVGSWAAEALARSGVAALRLIDLDHVAESNINRQVQALSDTVGQAKVLALQTRVAQIHPGCEVSAIEEFVDEANVADLLGGELLDGVIDCCDQVRAKAALAVWAQETGVPLVTVGAAGGKLQAQAVELADLAQVTHDPLLASLRQRLRQRHGGARKGAMGVACVFSKEAVRPPQFAPDAACEVPAGGLGDDQINPGDGSLNCHGYGSCVSVTATFGMVASGALIQQLLHRT